MNQVMLVHESNVSGIVVRGIDPEREAGGSDLSRNLVAGDLGALNAPREGAGVSPARPGIILGKELAMRLGVRLGNSVSMISPASRVTPVGLIPKMKLFTVVGFFQSGMFEYDATLAFISIPAAQKFFSMQDRVIGVEIWVDDIDEHGPAPPTLRVHQPQQHGQVCQRYAGSG